MAIMKRGAKGEPPGRGSKLESSCLGYVLLSPALVLILLVQIYPLLTGISYAFQDYNVLTSKPPRFTGLQNFQKVLTGDPTFWKVLAFSLVNTLCVVVLSYVAGLTLALLLNRKIRLRGVYRALILLPWIISNAVADTNWSWLLNDHIGFINNALKSLGLIDRSILFLADTTLVRVSVIMVGTWRSIPFMFVVLLAGLQSIPGEMYEAASIDGAGFWQSLTHITLPSIRTVTTMSTTLMFIWTINNFETIYLLTSGGPNEATTTLPIYIYNTAFFRGRIGYGSSIAVITLAIMVAVAVARFRLQRKAMD